MSDKGTWFHLGRLQTLSANLDKAIICKDAESLLNCAARIHAALSDLEKAMEVEARRLLELQLRASVQEPSESKENATEI